MAIIIFVQMEMFRKYQDLHFLEWIRYVFSRNMRNSKQVQNSRYILRISSQDRLSTRSIVNLIIL